jgi:hypothetical protein
MFKPQMSVNNLNEGSKKIPTIRIDVINNYITESN